jgi:adenylosuccinate synthase
VTGDTPTTRRRRAHRTCKVTEDSGPRHGDYDITYTKTIILLSGPIGSGKTTLAAHMERHYAACHISTSEILSESVGRSLDRRELQQVGLEGRFQGGEWIANAVTRSIFDHPEAKVVVVDAVRTVEQVRAIRNLTAGRWRILHVHLTADSQQLAERYDSRARRVDSGVDWSTATESLTETAIIALEPDADLAIDTTTATPDDVAVRVSSRVRSERQKCAPCVDALVGGQWGSEGKGNIAFFISSEYDLLVRVGGPNAGHRVCGHDGIVYTHRQLPSGTRATPATPLLIGTGAVINPSMLLQEVTECGVSADRLTIDPAALTIEDDDLVQETSLKSLIGSTGTGVGAALARRIVSRGVAGAVRLAKDVPELAPYVRDSAELLELCYSRGESILIEGTQGTDLSLLHGSFPHVTSRDTTVSALLSEVGIAPQRLRRVIVVFRAYPIRVGGMSGPMGQELTWETIAERTGLRDSSLSAVEVGSVSGKARRVAEFSWTQLRRSVRLNGATDIFLTFLDYLDHANKAACRFDQLTRETIRFVEEVELVASAPVSLISARFDGRGLIDRRQ